MYLPASTDQSPEKRSGAFFVRRALVQPRWPWHACWFRGGLLQSGCNPSWAGTITGVRMVHQAASRARSKNQSTDLVARRRLACARCRRHASRRRRVACTPARFDPHPGAARVSRPARRGGARGVNSRRRTADFRVAGILCRRPRACGRHGSAWRAKCAPCACPRVQGSLIQAIRRQIEHSRHKRRSGKKTHFCLFCIIM